MSRPRAWGLEVRWKPVHVRGVGLPPDVNDPAARIRDSGRECGRGGRAQGQGTCKAHPQQPGRSSPQRHKGHKGRRSCGQSPRETGQGFESGCFVVDRNGFAPVYGEEPAEAGAENGI